MRILVLGGDGYLGWPTALHLSQRGHDIGVVDNLIRRHYDQEMGVDTLVPIRQLQRRVATWKEISGNTVVPLIGSDAYHRGAWKTREKRRWAKLFEATSPRA